MGQQKGSSGKRRLEVTVDVRQPEVGESGPYAAYFPSGVPPAGAGVKFRAYHNEEYRRTHQQILVGRGNTVDYVGGNFLGETVALNPCQYAIGCFDKATGTLELMSAACGKVLRMEPRVVGVPYEEAAVNKEGNEEETEEQKLVQRKAQRAMLTETFGSKKARRDALAREREKVDTEAIAAPAALTHLLATAAAKLPKATNLGETSGSQAEVPRNIPPHDVTATSLEGTYPIELLTPAEKLVCDEVKELQKVIQDMPDIDEWLRFKWGQYALAKLPRLQIEGDEEGNTKRTKALVHLRHLIRFYHLPMGALKKELGTGGERLKVVSAKHAEYTPTEGGGVQKLSQTTGIPANTLSQYIERFNEKEEADAGAVTYFRSQKLRDLLVSYILVFALWVNGWSLNPVELAGELKVPLANLLPRLKELGCKAEVRRGGGDVKYKVWLEAPLQFPKLRSGRQAGK